MWKAIQLHEALQRGVPAPVVWANPVSWSAILALPLAKVHPADKHLAWVHLVVRMACVRPA